MTDPRLDALVELKERIQLLACGTGIILAAVPSTVLVPLPLSQLVTRRFHREHLLTKMHRMVPWARFCARTLCGVKLDVRGRRHLPLRSRGYMFVSNHQSYADILVLMEALGTAAFLSKGLVRHFPLLGRSAYCGGSVFLKRSDPADRQRALKETMDMCQRSTAVVVFPEGTRSDDGQLCEKIHPRAMQEAWRLGIRVIPVGLDGTRNVIPKTMDRLHRGQPVAVRIGPSLDPAAFDSGEAYAEACWRAVAELTHEARSSGEALRQGSGPRPECL